MNTSNVPRSSDIQNTPPSDMLSTNIENTSPIDTAKTKVVKEIENATYFTIQNATNPVTMINQKTGTIYAIYMEGIADTVGAATSSSPANVFLIKSTDKGKTFSKPIRINEKDGDADLAVWEHPSIALGNEDQVYVKWYNNTQSSDSRLSYGITQIHFSRSIDGGNSFEPTINKISNDPGQEQNFADMVVSKNNKIYISYLGQNYFLNDTFEGMDSTMRVVSSGDGGKTFENSVIVDNDSCSCCQTTMTLGPDDQAYVSWRHTYKVNPVALNSTDEKTNPFAYRDQSWANPNLIVRDIVVSKTTDNGDIKSFSAPVKFHDDNWLMNGCPDAGPGMAFDAKGRLHVAWFTGSDKALQGPGYYYAYSDDKGQTFSKPLPLHLLSEKWIVPTSLSLTVDDNNYVWVTFVNDEQVYDKDYNAINSGNVHLSVLDDKSNLIWNGAFAKGHIVKHYPLVSAGNQMVSLSWIDGNDVKLATFKMS